MTEPIRQTKVNAHFGRDKRGRSVRRPLVVRTAYNDHARIPWDCLLGRHDQRRWIDLIDQIHEAMVELARLPVRHRRLAEVHLGERIRPPQPEDLAMEIRQAIQATRPALSN